MKHLLYLYLFMFIIPEIVFSQEWPQFQHDAARTGRSSVEIPPPYRARWIWLGENQTLRNQQSEPGWTDNLTSEDGYSLPLPESVPFTISQQLQPVIAGGRLFFGTQDGMAYALNTFDGSTAWSFEMPGPVVVSGAVDDQTVIFTTLNGHIMGLNVESGTPAWSFSTGYAITSAPLIHRNTVFAGNHFGTLTALNSQSGVLNWEQTLTAPIVGGIAADGNTVYVPCEDMNVYALEVSSGAIRASNRVKGQGFRITHPVVYNGRLWVTSCMTALMGSEFVMEQVMASSTSIANEDANVALWLTGNDNGGAWPHASEDWQHRFALDTADLSQPYLIPVGPTEGCGIPPNSFVVDHSGRILCWWKTRFPMLTTDGAFGTNYSLDICAVNETTGLRQVIDNGKLSGIVQETDNLYAMTSGGKYLWLRQDFRGTQVIDLTTSDSRFVLAPVRNLDGGYWNADIVYFDWRPNFSNYQVGHVVTSMQTFYGRTAPAIAGNFVFIAENFCIIAIEHDNQ
jgi:outer membrane protein assembly factor BamB